jgi:2-isopropylmalate synthase
VLCDTNGGTQPGEIHEIVAEIVKHIPGENLGIHAHDDTGQAVSNSLAAIDAGVRQIQGTLNGIGERCGNANLVTIIGTLSLKPIYSDRYETGVSKQQLAELTRYSHKFDEILNRAPDSQAAYVGTSAFATKAGIHASAILKEPETYEHVKPADIGNSRRVMVSGQGGKANFLTELERCGVKVSKDDPRLDSLIATIKEREAKGYAYEAAEASFELLARRRLGHVKKLFHVESYRTQVERRYNANGEITTVSEAVVKVEIDGEHILSVAEGQGPVNALDRAIRKDLGKFQKDIEDLELVDFKVRILNGGTEAITRVLIDSIDASGRRWTTIGVSENIIDASFQALVDSINYKLMIAVNER